MYSYSHDADTGGLLLRPEPLAFSLEPRPVYHRELTLLGFDKICQYPRSDEAPIMWAEANNYFYRGRKVARATGGSLYGAPRLEVLDEGLRGSELVSVDVAAMVERNRGLVDSLAEEAMGFVYNKRRRYARQVDLFYVAYSGGKDSQVVLDLVRRALPADAFKVLFGDTLMEFPDTYSAVEQTSAECRASGIDFVRARSHLEPAQSWRLFGPPATVQRWCCSVHKTAPQVLALRRLTGKADCRGFAFIGIRGAESERRSEYQRVAVGKKHTGQWNAYPILDWNSAELFAYMLQRRLLVNEAYKRGSHRVGCLMCPRAAERSDYVAQQCYPEEMGRLVASVREAYEGRFRTDAAREEFIANGGWKARKCGDDICQPFNYEDRVEGESLIISIKDPHSNWREWIKTLGDLSGGPQQFSITTKLRTVNFKAAEEDGILQVALPAMLSKTAANFVKQFKFIFHKAALCVGCGECEANCPTGSLHFVNGKISIANDCTGCGQCRDLFNGCLLFDSTRKTKQMTVTNPKSLNSYSHHAPKMEWFDQLFQLKDKFLTDNTLGSRMLFNFKRFLRDADILSGTQYTPLGRLFLSRSPTDESCWGLILANLAYTPQTGWALTHVDVGQTAEDKYLREQLVSDGAKPTIVPDVLTCFNRLGQLPIANVGYPRCVKTSSSPSPTYTLTRHPWPHPSPLAVLYSLYLYAERCGGLHHFTLPRLYDPSVQADGISPARIYGLDADTLRALLQGLAIAHPDFIGVSFTHGLDAVDLNETRQHGDVIALFNTDKP